MQDRWKRKLFLSCLAATLAVGAAACGDDDGGTDTEGTTTTGEGATTTAGEGATGETIEVTASDYEFSGVPDTVAAGSRFSLTTAEGGEPHEFVVFPRPDGETRPLDELIELPQEELEAIFAGEPTMVILALVGQTDVPGPVVGDGTVTDPGDYIYVCAFPQGTTDEDVQNATGPLEGEGPPHFVLGMRGEFTVE